MLSAVKDRERTILEALQAAELAKEEMKKLSSENEKLLQEARMERDKIVKDALQAASKLRQEALDNASLEASKLVESARRSIETEKEAAKTELLNMVAALSLEVAEKVLRKQLQSDKVSKELIEQYLKEVKLN
jgi:F-type H+-transporting ATPase subunit b